MECFFVFLIFLLKYLIEALSNNNNCVFYDMFCVFNKKIGNGKIHA